MLASLLAVLPLVAQPPLAGSPNPNLAASPPPTATPAGLLERVTVLGASLSDGYGLKGALGFRATFATYFDASLTGGRSVHTCRSDSRFFVDPEQSGQRLAQRALADDPSLVVALDFLFWYVHGDRFPTEKHRLESLEEGLKLLAQFRCPLVVADVPDVRVALKGKGPLGVPMVYPQMLPHPNTLNRINTRIREWVKARGGAFVKLNRFLGRIVDGGAFALRGNAWPANSLEHLMQSDLLHPNAVGYLGVLVIVQDAMARELEGVADSDFHWKVEEIESAFLALTENERAAAAAKGRARAERQRKRGR